MPNETSTFEVQKAVEKLPAEAATTLPSMPVKVQVFEAKQLVDAAIEHKSVLEGLPGFNFHIVNACAAASEALDVAERKWLAEKQSLPVGAKDVVRTGAEDLKAEVVKSARYLFRDDKPVLAKVDAILDGDGSDADLAGDMTAIVALLTEKQKAFEGDKFVPPNAVELAQRYEKDLRGRKDTSSAQQALRYRNQLAYLLDDQAEEIRAAARYIFRKEPKILAKFVSVYAASKLRRSRKKKTSPVPE